MRKLMLSMMVSLDGLVVRRGRFGVGSWSPPPDDPALKARKLEWMQDVGHHLMGRSAYEEKPSFGRSRMTRMRAHEPGPKVVFSRTLKLPDWADSRIARGDLAQEVATLRQESGGDLLAWGGARPVPRQTRAGGRVPPGRPACGARQGGSPVQGSHRADGARARRRRHTPVERP